MSKYKDPSPNELLMHQAEYKYPIPAMQDLFEQNFSDSIQERSGAVNLAYLAKHLHSDAKQLSYWNKDASYLEIALDFMLAALDYANHYVLTGVDLEKMDIKEYGVFEIGEPLKLLERSPNFWTDAMNIATIRGNEEALRALAKIEPSIFMNKVGNIGGRADFVAGYIAFLAEEKEKALKHFQKAAEGAKAHAGDHFMAIDLPLANTMIQLLSDADQELMEAYLFTTFSAHRTYYDQKKGLNRGDSPLKDSLEAVFPLRQISLLTLIRAHFPDLHFKTDYCPDWLLD
jgi:hypothetical protein